MFSFQCGCIKVILDFNLKCINFPYSFFFKWSVAIASVENHVLFNRLSSWVPLLFWQGEWRFVSLPLSTERGNTNRALSGHIFFKSGEDMAGSPWCATFINKPTVRQETDLIFRFKDTFYNIFTSPLRPVCWHYKLQAKVRQSIC